MCFLFIATPSPRQSQPTPTKRVVEGRYRGQRWGASARIISNITASYWDAKWCAFLLQLSEGLTKGKTQLCSNILIIYCSVAHIIVHHHLECSSGLKRNLTSITEHSSVLPDISYIISCCSIGWKGRLWQRRKVLDPPFFFFFFGQDLGISNWIISSECHYLITFYLCYFNIID